MSTTEQGLELATATDLELAKFAKRHGVTYEQLARCREYLQAAPPARAMFRLLSLPADPESSAPPTFVLRLVRHDQAWVELPAKFPTEHLLALLELLDGG